MSDDAPVLWRQILSFGLVGGLSAGTHYAVYVGLVAAGWLGPTPATVVGFLVGTAVSFVLNARVTFAADMTPATATRFTLVTHGGGGLNTFVVWAGTGAGLDYRLVGLAGIVLGAAFNFAGHKLWTFRETTPSASP